MLRKTLGGIAFHLGGHLSKKRSVLCLRSLTVQYPIFSVGMVNGGINMVLTAVVWPHAALPGTNMVQNP